MNTNWCKVYHRLKNGGKNLYKGAVFIILSFSHIEIFKNNPYYRQNKNKYTIKMHFVLLWNFYFGGEILQLYTADFQDDAECSTPSIKLTDLWGQSHTALHRNQAFTHTVHMTKLFAPAFNAFFKEIYLQQVTINYPSKWQQWLHKPWRKPEDHITCAA